MSGIFKWIKMGNLTYRAETGILGLNLSFKKWEIYFACHLKVEIMTSLVNLDKIYPTI